MKEIGQQLAEARDSMGVTLDEAATDLKLKPSQLENIEAGNRSAFKDVFELKQIIRDYAKYLSLEYEKLEDDFNEFVFEYTSKIPLEEIAKANEEMKEKERDIVSPYTIEHKRKFKHLKYVILIAIIMIAIITILVINNIKEKREVESVHFTDFTIWEWYCEFT